MSMSNLSTAYVAARSVYEGKTTTDDAIGQLSAEYGINEASASYAIRVFRHLMRGEVFKRGLSAPDMDSFLTGITHDYGSEQLRTAVHALWLHLAYYEAKKKTTLHKLRLVAAKHQAHAAAIESYEQTESTFSTAVKQSMADSAAARDLRLNAAPKIPARRILIVVAFDRNPDVVAAVLTRAAGKCERCNLSAPFIRRKSRTPYLEVHHRKLLADDGEDTVDNAEALCPNCHRELHYGGSAA